MTARRLFATVSGALRSSWAVFFVAVFVRLWVFAQVLTQRGPDGFYQFNEQARIAWSLVSGHGFSSPWINTPLLPTAQQPPLYPFLLALIFKLAGPYSTVSLCVAEALNAVFAALTGVLILHIGARSFHAAAGIVAAWVWAVWQYEAVVSIRVWESSLSGLLLIVSLWWLLKLTNFPPPANWLGFGVLAGISGLTNTALLAVFPCFLLWLWIKGRKQRVASYRLYVGASALACLLTLAPWTARNYLRFHRWIPVRDNFGFELWQGNHPGPKADAGEYVRLGEIPFMEAKQEAALEFIAQAPADFLLRCVRRFQRFWTDPDFLWLPLSALAWFGLGAAFWRRRDHAVPFAMFFFSFPLVYYVTHPGATYRHPIESEIVLLAAYAVVCIVGRKAAEGRSFS